MITQRAAADADIRFRYSPIVAVLHDPVPGSDPDDAADDETLTPSWVFISESANTTRLILRRPTALDTCPV